MYMAQPMSGGASMPGGIFVCFNPQANCFLAVVSPPFGSKIPFTIETMGDGLHIASAYECGEKNDLDPRHSFDVMLGSEEPGNGCLNSLMVTKGKFEGGMLVEDPKGPAIKIDTNMMIGTKPLALLVDGLPLIGDFVKGGFLNIPGYHKMGGMKYSFEVHIPLMQGGIVVRNKDTDEVVARGSVNNTCGAQLGPPVTPIPTVPQYGLMLLAASLLLAAVRMTRRGMSA